MMGYFNDYWVFQPNVGKINDIHDAVLKPMFKLQTLIYLYK